MEASLEEKDAERESFTNKHESHEEKRTTTMSKAQRKPYLKNPSEENKRVEN